MFCPALRIIEVWGHPACQSIGYFCFVNIECVVEQNCYPQKQCNGKLLCFMHSIIQIKLGLTNIFAIVVSRNQFISAVPVKVVVAPDDSYHFLVNRWSILPLKIINTVSMCPQLPWIFYAPIHFSQRSISCSTANNIRMSTRMQ